MKVLFLILASVVLVAAKPMLKSRQEVDKIQSTCIKRANLPEEVMERARVSEYPLIETMPSVLCFFREVGWWTDAQGFQTDIMMESLDKIATRRDLNKAKLRESIEKCKDEKAEGESLLDWGHRNLMCFAEHKYLWDPLKRVKFYDDEIEQE